MPSGSSIHISVRPQGSAGGLPDDRDSGRGQPGVLGADIPYLDPDHHRAPGRAVRVPGDLEQPLAEEEHHPGIVRGDRTPGRWPGPACRGRSGGCSPGRRGAGGSGCSERPRHHFSITLSEAGGQGERAQSRRPERTPAGFGQDNGRPDPGIPCLCSVAGRTSVNCSVIPGGRCCPSPCSRMGLSVAVRDLLS